MFNLVEQFKYDTNFRITSSIISLNNFFFYLRKIPLIGKKIPNKIFNLQSFKSFLGIFLLVTNYLFLFIKKILIMLFFGLWMVLAHYNHGDFSQFILIAWAIISCFGYPIANIFSVGGISTQLFNFSTWFHLDPKFAIYNDIILNPFINSIVYFPILLVTGLITHNPLLGINVAFIYFLMQLVFISANLFIIKVINLKKQTKNYTQIFLIGIEIIILIAAFAFVQFFPKLSIFIPIFSSPLATIISIILTITMYFVFSISLKKFPLSKIIDLYQFDKDTSSIDSSTLNENEYVTSGKEYVEKLTLDQNAQIISTNYKDNNFLNYLLFKRYRRILTKRLKRRILIILGITLVLGLIFLLAKENIPLFSKQVNFLSLLPSMFFFLYIAALGKDIVSLCFVNCDQAMLYYPFYREPKAIIKGFFYRFKISLIYNMLIVLTMFVSFTVIQYLSNPTTQISSYLIMLATSLSLGLLFSFHYLFVYYILQPFTVDGSVKNPIFKMIDYIFYLIAYFQLQLGDNLGINLYPVIIISVALIYVALGTLAIYRYAPKTFKIRK